MSWRDSRSIWDCSFTYTSFTLAALYLCVLLFVVRALFVLFRQPKRRAQKLFLVFVAATAVCRTVYFLGWPLIGRSCRPRVVGGSFSWVDVMGTIPAGFFLSSFSVLVYTFARIFHRVLRGTRLHHRLFVTAIASMVLVNVAVYAISIAIYFTPRHNGVAVYIVSGASFFIAGGFLLYGVLLYTEVGRVLAQYRAEEQEPLLTHERQRRRWGKIAVVAAACMACFLVRTIALPLMYKRWGAAWSVVLVYFFVAELVPLALMLNVFDTKAASGTHARRSMDRRGEMLLSGKS